MKGEDDPTRKTGVKLTRGARKKKQKTNCKCNWVKKSIPKNRDETPRRVVAWGRTSFALLVVVLPFF